MTELQYNIRDTQWYRRWFGSGWFHIGNWRPYEDFYMWKKRRMVRAWRGAIAENMAFLVKNNFPIYRVEIDLMNKCNMDCTFCHQSITTYKEPLLRLPDKIFESFMEQLGKINYNHSLYLSCNFEPTLDKDLVKKAKIARELVPKAYLLFFTNALVLNTTKYHDLMQYLSMMFIDNYTMPKGFDRHLPIRPMLGKTMKDMSAEEAHRTVIYLRMQNEILDTISMEAPSRSKWQTLDIGCTYPLSELYLGADGNCYLCSKDVMYRHPYGNLGLQSLKEVWYGEQITKYRNSLLNHWRKGIDICEKCDFVRRNYDETMELNQIYTQPKTIESLEISENKQPLVLPMRQK